MIGPHGRVPRLRMADTITFMPKDDEGERILDEFEQQTDLEAGDRRGGDAARVYPLEGDDHQIEIVETLTDIDARVERAHRAGDARLGSPRRSGAIGAWHTRSGHGRRHALPIAVWRARLRWRLAGAWQWPAFCVLTAVDAVVLSRLPFAGGRSTIIGSLLAAGLLNMILLAVVPRPGGWLLRRRRPDLPREIAADFAGAGAMAVLSRAVDRRRGAAPAGAAGQRRRAGPRAAARRAPSPPTARRRGTCRCTAPTPGSRRPTSSGPASKAPIPSATSAWSSAPTRRRRSCASTPTSDPTRRSPGPTTRGGSGGRRPNRIRPVSEVVNV